ncbi:MAG: nickel pincer cofactor biosynthesis protein LarB [Oscillospiraceae bacterium]|jgi:NCAIR mutase (PurE)-related protein|nr:nickel pincer cofactor biosynthesis protein LarB [Oscillospiraceae bacterium]
MNINDILERVRRRELDTASAAELLRTPAYDDLGYAMVDHQRSLRTGESEVIYCAGKTPGQIAGIFQNMISRGAKNILATRADAEAYRSVAEHVPDIQYHASARIITLRRAPQTVREHGILVACAGTSDLPVADEAAVTAEFLGNRVERISDVGVAGLHRLLSKLDGVRRADVIIVAAGMEGALASVVGGLTDKPVIAVPTSVGYGASFGGLAALLAMLNCCASGVGVVNIDNGFGAAFLANSIVRLAEKYAKS